MLLLTFNIADERYAIDTRNVIEVIPVVNLKSLPLEEEYIAGVFDYHGTFVPVIDISRLCRNQQARNTLTTRIILLDIMDKKTIGIIAENLTETLHVSDKDLSSCGIEKLNAAFLGDITQNNKDIIQLVNTDQILGQEVKTRLFDVVEAG